MNLFGKDWNMSAGGVLMPDQFRLRGFFDCELVRDGKTIDKWTDPNLVVDEGLNAILNIMFNEATQIPTWYVGIFEGNYTPVAGVTAATMPSASTECTAYSESTRPVYTEATSVAKSITNSASRATFSINASKTIYGAFLVSSATKGGTAGVLFAATRFGSSKAVTSDDQLLVTYTINASNV